MSPKSPDVPRTLNQAVEPAIAWELLRHEYTEAAVNFRHFSGLRFAIMSVYVGVVGGLGAVALKLVQSATDQASLWSAVSAVMVTIAFFIIECVCERNRHYYFSSLKALEEPLGYETARRHPKWSVVQARYVIAALYLSSLAFWVDTVCKLWQ
jgi:hypothetical protein